MTVTTAQTASDLSKLKSKILEIVATEGSIEVERLKPDAKLADIEFVSSDMIMVLMALEDEFDVYIPVDDSLSEAETVDELIGSLAAHVQSQKETK